MISSPTSEPTTATFTTSRRSTFRALSAVAVLAVLLVSLIRMNLVGGGGGASLPSSAAGGHFDANGGRVVSNEGDHRRGRKGVSSRSDKLFVTTVDYNNKRKKKQRHPTTPPSTVCSSCSTYSNAALCPQQKKWTAGNGRRFWNEMCRAHYNTHDLDSGFLKAKRVAEYKAEMELQSMSLKHERGKYVTRKLLRNAATHVEMVVAELGVLWNITRDAAIADRRKRQNQKTAASNDQHAVLDVLEFGCDWGQRAAAFAARSDVATVTCVDDSKTRITIGPSVFPSPSRQHEQKTAGGTSQLKDTDLLKLLRPQIRMAKKNPRTSAVSGVKKGAMPPVVVNQRRSPCFDVIHSTATLKNYPVPLQFALFEQLCDALAPTGVGWLETVHGQDEPRTDYQPRCNADTSAGFDSGHSYVRDADLFATLQRRGCHAEFVDNNHLWRNGNPTYRGPILVKMVKKLKQ